MGVDSGLSDFRGTEGFWKAYPALARCRIHFEDIACPGSFHTHPRLAWGFYGHRLQLYRQTKPHAGFGLLKAIGARMPRGTFVFTRNVDGHFQRAGFDVDRICERHGSIHRLQCLEPCSDATWSADDFRPRIDSERCQLLSRAPICPTCGGPARPNVLMFGDWAWNGRYAEAQEASLLEWRETVKKLAIIEIGAGSTIPTVRQFSESLDAPLIRINPKEADVPFGDSVSLPLPALTAIDRIARAVLENWTTDCTFAKVE
ncbi:MAG: NAD-dependent deacetylase [Gammaproteobacteria bacterium]|nr:NAD-dependent deacetylase [Gammaproteobacteria bacterium]